MKKLIAAITIIMSVCFLCSCGGTTDKKAYEGTWQLCGAIEEGNEMSIESAVIDDEFLETYGLSEMPNNTIKIDNNGITESVPGSEKGAIEPIDEFSFNQKEKISVVDGEELDTPLTAIWTVKEDNGYLIVSVEYDDPEYNGGDSSVYKKVK